MNKKVILSIASLVAVVGTSLCVAQNANAYPMFNNWRARQYHQEQVAARRAYQWNLANQNNYGYYPPVRPVRRFGRYF